MSSNDPPSKKISVSSNGADSETPPRKKSSLKENICSLVRASNFVVNREAAKKRWNQVCENLRLNRIKVAVTESKLFAPGTFVSGYGSSLVGEERSS
uniref:Regulatory protein zeste n=1 Tax=Angiostrongylus cantonensis TaxID=6313 RepID=A0A0K0CYL1_ANGCA